MKNQAMKLLFRCVSVFACAGVTLILAFSAVGCASNDIAKLRVHSYHLVGDTLSLIVETSRRHFPLLSDNSVTKDAKGYCIVIDLSSKQPLKDRARVFGPIWDVPKPRSSLGFDVGFPFTPDDADVAAATPWCSFDAKGTLLRFTRKKSQDTIVRDELVVRPTSASWQRQRNVIPVDDSLPPLSEDRLLSESKRFVLLFQNGRAKCFDLFTGDRIDDPWLTERFAEVRSIHNLENIRFFLTEDLNHLVGSPREGWNSGQKIFYTFDFNGKIYKRSDVGLAYSRLTEVPTVFRRKAQAGFLVQPPHAAFSIGGELFLFMSDKTMLRLYSPDGNNEMVVHATPEVQWDRPYSRIQHAPEAGEIILYDTVEDFHNMDFNVTASIVRWKYKSNSVTRDEVRFADLFTRRGGRLLPKSRIGVD